MADTDHKQTDISSEDERKESIELRPDAEARFRAAIRAAAKSGPMHRPAKVAKR